MPVTFSAVSAMEVLDSRGRPTVSVRMALSDGREVCAGVPVGGIHRQWGSGGAARR